MLVKAWPTLGSPPQSGTEIDDCGDDHRTGVQTTDRLVLLRQTTLSCHDRPSENVGEPARMSHISKMVLSILTLC